MLTAVIFALAYGYASTLNCVRPSEIKSSMQNITQLRAHKTDLTKGNLERIKGLSKELFYGIKASYWPELNIN